MLGIQRAVIPAVRRAHAVANMRSMFRMKAISTGLVVGIMVGAAFFLFSFLTVFGICSDTSAAVALFPFAVITDPTLDDRWWLALPLALIQYPIYGMLFGYVWMRKRSLLWAWVLALLVAHVTSAHAASARVEALHERIWQQVR